MRFPTFLLSSLLFCVCHLQGAEPEAVIPPGTRLVYVLQWSIFPVGEAVFTVDGPVDYKGEKAYTLTLEAKTNSFADKFYKVRNSSTSWLSEDWSRSLHFENHQSEGGHEREVVIDFDWEKGTAQYSNYDKKEAPVALSGDCYDPFGVTLGVCRLALVQGASFPMNITNGKSLMTNTIYVAETERVKVPLGKLETLLLEPETKDIGGVFRKSEDASMRIWVSADEHQIPVRLQSEVAVGSFWGELVRVEGPLAGAYAFEEEDRALPKRRGGRR